MVPHRLLRIAAGFLVLVAAVPCGRPVPRAINYQARLTDSGGAPVKTAVTLTFTFWDAESGGAQLGGGYSDAKLVQPDANGVVSTQVGSDPGNPVPASVFAGSAVWLRAMLGAQEIVPRVRVGSVGYAFRAADADAVGGVAAAAIASMADAFPRRGGAHVVVETTASATVNGANLLAAYAAAKALSPNGKARSADNRATVLVPPGAYDLGAGQLVLDTEFVDLVGMSTARDDQHVSGTSSGVNTGVLRQTANDVRIENLVVECTRTSVTAAVAKYAPAAYFPDDGTTQTVVRNCEFRSDDVHAWAMRLGTAYPGTFTDCKAGQGSFGFGAAASGTFTRCTAADYSFGAFYGDASGTFTDCVGGEYAFGGDHALASGRLNGCHGGDYSFGGYHGEASGTFSAAMVETTPLAATRTQRRAGTSGTAPAATMPSAARAQRAGNSPVAQGAVVASAATGAQQAAPLPTALGWVRSFSGNGGTASGTFTDCCWGSQCAFGGDGGLRPAERFTNLHGHYNYAFGGDGARVGQRQSSRLQVAITLLAEKGAASGRSRTASIWPVSEPAPTGGRRFRGARLRQLPGNQRPDAGGAFLGADGELLLESGFVCAPSARIYGSTFAGTLDLGNTSRRRDAVAGQEHHQRGQQCVRRHERCRDEHRGPGCGVRRPASPSAAVMRPPPPPSRA